MAVMAVIVSVVAASASMATIALASPVPRCELKRIQRDGPRKVGMYDYTAVVRLTNPSGRERRVVSTWDVDGSRIRIRKRIAADDAVTVSKDLGYGPRRPRMSLRACVFARRRLNGPPHSRAFGPARRGRRPTSTP
jgi:hypothetical protein